MVSRFVQDIIGDMTGMTGVFISSIFSASLSTISITLNTQAGIIYMDFIRPLNLIRHTERNSNYSMKFLIFLIGTFSIVGGIAIEKLGSLFRLVYTLSGICGGPIVGVFTLGMLHPWANRHVSVFISRKMTFLPSSMYPYFPHFTLRRRIGSIVWSVNWYDWDLLYHRQHSGGHWERTIEI